MKQILTKSAKHSVTVENDVLVVRINKSWYDYIGYNFGSSKITVYLPKTEYNALFINESTGNVEIPKDYLFDNVDISLSTVDVVTGSAYLTDSLCRSVISSVITGSISLNNVIQEVYP